MAFRPSRPDDPACPIKEEFEKSARERVLALEGVDDVDVTMTANTRGSRTADLTASGRGRPTGASLSRSR